MTEEQDIPQEPAVPVRMAWHECRRCGRSFAFRYEGIYDTIHLMEIDYICRACLAAYVQQVELEESPGVPARTTHAAS